MEAYADLESLQLAATFSDAIHSAIPDGASDSLCMDALELALLTFARSAIEGGSPKAALVLMLGKGNFGRAKRRFQRWPEFWSEIAQEC